MGRARRFGSQGLVTLGESSEYRQLPLAMAGNHYRFEGLRWRRQRGDRAFGMKIRVVKTDLPALKDCI
jgi:hypothetical protein